MLKFYRYLYYRAYDIIKLTGDYDLTWGASHFLSFFISLFIFDLILLFKWNIGQQALGFLGVLFFVFFHVLNYFFFLKGDKYKVVLEMYNLESKQTRLIGRLTILLSLVILIYIIF
jgi:hypothetical protein